MNQIKFSHIYEKMPDDIIGKKVQLIDIVEIHKANLMLDFIEYDTRYIENGIRKHYPLPNTELIILGLKVEDCQINKIKYCVFKSPLNASFTTVRKYTPWKWNYYFSNLGKKFEIVLVENGGK